MAAAPPPASLSDAEIERFSRQIILPEIGGAGQARLLATAVVMLGSGPLAETAALYLAGAGIGRIALVDANGSLAASLIDLQPGVVVQCGAPLESACDIVVACDAAPASIGRVGAADRSIIAAALSDSGGWLVIGARGRACASCVAHRYADSPHDGLRPELVSVAAGVLGSLVALEVVKHRLGRAAPAAGELRFDVALSTLTEHAIVPHRQCPVCSI